MNLRNVSLGLATGIALASLCLAMPSYAQSQTPSASRSRAPAISLSEANAARSAAPAASARRGLRLNDSGRWGLDLNLAEPVGRERDLGDVEAGAYYRVNPRLRLGASAGLANPEPDPAQPTQTDRRSAPRFRLESIFRF